MIRRLFASALFLLAACSTTEDPARERFRAWCGETGDDVIDRVDALVEELPLWEKASLMHGSFPVPLDGTWQTTAYPDLGIPGFHMLDGPRGLSRFSGEEGTAFPVAMARGATWDPALEGRVGRMIGAELRVVGADTLLAPTVNILRHPRWGRAQETYGEDPHHMGALGTAFVLGAQEHVMAVVKHYAANSIENTRLEVDVNVDERTLREIYLPHFRRIVTEGRVAGVMTAYNQVNGEWASEQRHLIQQILRSEWGFEGFTVSDFLWGTHDTIPALQAGLDVEMPSTVIYGMPVVNAVEAGDAEEAWVNAAARRILRAQLCHVDARRDPEITEPESDEALALAEEVARRAMVLLENREEALPIDRDAAPNIVVVGTLADDPNTGDEGSSDVRSTEVTTMLEGLVADAGSATVTRIEGDLSATEDQDAVAAADVVIAVVGYSEDEEGEGQIAAGDRVSLALPSDDIAIMNAAAALNDRVVAVVIAGSSFITDGWGDAVEAIVVAWYAGARGGDALAGLLYGEDNFSGRLPISFAARDEDLPPFDNVSLEVEYGYFHGYRHLQNEGTAPLYPFGFGLSYTDVSYEALRVNDRGETIEVEVDLENPGDRAAIETVQVYVGNPEGPDARAPRDLRGFAQVTVPAGGEATATITIREEDLRRFDADVNAWRLDAGMYRVEVGPNVETLPLEATVTRLERDTR